MEQKKYHSIVRLGHKSTVGVLNEGDEIIVQEKIDGCFQYDTRITLADGSTEKIGVIVNNKMDVEVISYNFETGQFEPKRVTNWFNHGAKKDFIAIRVASVNGSRPNRIMCTPDHLFYTNFGWVEAKDLTVEHVLYTCNNKLNEIQKQLILGTLLGDSSVYPNNQNETRNRSITYNHSLKQKEYVDFKNKLMGGFYKSIESYTSGYGSEGLRSRMSCTLATEEIVKICMDGNKKTVNQEWLNSLSSIGMAFWYMDDGSLSHNNGQRDRAIFHTQGFTESEVDLIIAHLSEKWGMQSSKIKTKGAEGCGFIISLSSDSSERLFSMIAPYICASMQYKLPNHYRTGKCFLEDSILKQETGLVEVKFVEHCDLPTYPFTKDNYDLEVEGNHNYLANGVLVHNSNASFMLHEGELLCFSRNTQLDPSNTLSGFYNWVHENIDPDKLLDGVIYFGEWTATHKIVYPNHTKKFFLFDVYNTHLEEYVNFSMVVDEAMRLGLNLIPVFYRGMYQGYDHLTAFIGMTQLGGILKGKHPETGEMIEKETGEGIVVKNVNYRDRHGKQLFVKLVVDDFREIQKQKAPKDPNKISETRQLVLSCLTPARIEKHLFKLVDEGVLSPDYTLKDMGFIIKQLGHVIAQDIIDEELQDYTGDTEVIYKDVAKVFPPMLRNIIINRQ